ncbi:restriction endonuclease subunit S [Streptococcus sp. 16.1]|nr:MULTISPECIES: restriction endonuclease subunit S [unclassified Streptococcus]MBK5034586.1 restriction endonuclease subunit S [Streptococcus sp. 15.1]MBK5140641.1 restriction endonuclease subunit S [Streptococcus sp. 16.1]
MGSTSIIGFDNSFDYSGDFILTARVGANAGEIYKYSGEAKITDNTVYIKSNCLDYLYYSLLHYNLKRLSFGTGQPLIKTSELKKIKIFFPSSLEQTAIGTLFRTLDDLLASYKDNLANYQSLKATMLSKMFPKAGQTVPEIRLDGYKGEWDLIKLGDFCDLITKGTTGKSQSEQGKVNFVKVENLKDNEIYPIVKISEEEHFGSLKRSILYEGDILFSIAGTLGRTAIVKNNILPANTNQALAIIRGYKLDAYFLLVVLSGEVVKDYIRKNPTVGAQPNLSLEQVSSLKIKIPSLEEQQAIGAYFSNLDNLINSYQDKISQLETLKKKLLQDMFI